MIEKEEIENSKSYPQGGPWWKPAFEIFSEISTWIAVPIILALIGGKSLDKSYGTKPLLLLVCTAVAFLISSYGIIKAVKKYTAKMKK